MRLHHEELRRVLALGATLSLAGCFLDSAALPGETRAGDAGPRPDASTRPRDAGSANRCVAVAEICNDADDDCDGDVDEDLYRPCARECGAGLERCRRGRYRDCSAPDDRECEERREGEDDDDDDDDDEEHRRGRR